MENHHPDEYVRLNQYIIIRRQKYCKLHFLSEKSNNVLLGKDKIELDAVAGSLFGTSFKIIPVKGSSRHFTLNVCDPNECVSLSMLMKDVSSGVDNRNLFDDGSSQRLSSDSIMELREQGISPKEIMNQLLEHSTTFQNKTEYSQEKYLKKKEKKYFEYITIERPSLRAICELFYKRDLPKTVGLRIDVISQIITGINLQPDGSYLLFENGFHGVVTAACLNYLHGGKLIHITPGNHPQRQAVLAMNFDEERMSHLLTVRLSTLLGHLDKSNETDSMKNDKNETSCSEDVTSTSSPSPSSSSLQISSDRVSSNTEVVESEAVEPTTADTPSHEDVDKDELLNVNCKRKHSCDITSLPDNFKKPRWAVDVENAADILTSQKVHGLIVVCREYPNNILLKFLQYVGLSRPLIVYSLFQEPIVQLYIQLKKMRNIISLRITDCWLREYQVLPDRTHPSIVMSPTSGYLLSGIVVSGD